jgi:hypothetical protein
MLYDKDGNILYVHIESSVIGIDLSWYFKHPTLMFNKELFEEIKEGGYVSYISYNELISRIKKIEQEINIDDDDNDVSGDISGKVIRIKIDTIYPNRKFTFIKAYYAHYYIYHTLVYYDDLYWREITTNCKSANLRV